MQIEKQVMPAGGILTKITKPGLPDIFSKEGESQEIFIAPDGRQVFNDGVSFRGGSGEVRQELEKILANWPDGVVSNGTFSVYVGVNVKINSTDWEVNLQNLSSDQN